MSGISEAARRGDVALEAPPVAALGHIDGVAPAAAPASGADADGGDGLKQRRQHPNKFFHGSRSCMGMGEARAEELEQLEAEERDLVRRKNAVRKDIKKKKQRDPVQGRE